LVRQVPTSQPARASLFALWLVLASPRARASEPARWEWSLQRAAAPLSALQQVLARLVSAQQVPASPLFAV